MIAPTYKGKVERHQYMKNLNSLNKTHFHMRVGVQNDLEPLNFPSV